MLRVSLVWKWTRSKLRIMEGTKIQQRGSRRLAVSWEEAMAITGQKGKMCNVTNLTLMRVVQRVQRIGCGMSRSRG